MVTGGCECQIWQKIINDPDTKVGRHAPDDLGTPGYWTLGNYYFIDYCPWCGTKLTPPPEEVGDESI